MSEAPAAKKRIHVSYGQSGTCLTCLAGSPDVAEEQQPEACASIAEAIGRLIMDHPDSFGVELVIRERGGPGPEPRRP